MSNRTIIDARGAFCPGPLMELIAALRLMQAGEEVEILSSDKGSVRDIPEWIKKVQHEMVSKEEKEGYWSIVVRKTK